MQQRQGRGSGGERGLERFLTSFQFFELRFHARSSEAIGDCLDQAVQPADNSFEFPLGTLALAINAQSIDLGVVGTKGLFNELGSHQVVAKAV